VKRFPRLLPSRPAIVQPLTFAALAAAALTGCATATPGGSGSSDARPRNLILVVADGAGTATWSLDRIARGADMAVARMPVAGLVDTRAVGGGITDSAAGATAYAIGTRTFNGAIGVEPRCAELWARDSVAVLADPASCAPGRTLLERAEAAGLATGLVTTTWVTDATPAAFAAHAPSRYMHADIARQMIASGVDVLMGGGRGVFDGTGDPTAGDLLTGACADVDCPADAAALVALRPSERMLIGLFNEGEMPAALERSPDLATMTRVALDRLGRDPDGFFLLVETEGTDSGQHANDPVDAIREEIVQLDRAIELALDYAARHPETLVVVTSDHETGGMALHRASGEWTLQYTGGGHTGTMVPIFAFGPEAERFGGIHDNDEIGRLLRSALLGGS
jgi:alkaline phosphatase